MVARRSPAVTTALRALTRLASTPAVCLAVAGTAIGLRAYRGAERPAMPALPILLIGIGLRRASLAASRRQRPAAGDWLYPATGYSFPSGHSTNAAMAAVLLSTAARDAELPVWPVVAAAGGCYAIGVGGSRVYLGVHWPSDVLAGWALGLGWTCTARRYFLRRRRK